MKNVSENIQLIKNDIIYLKTRFKTIEELKLILTLSIQLFLRYRMLCHSIRKNHILDRKFHWVVSIFAGYIWEKYFASTVAIDFFVSLLFYHQFKTIARTLFGCFLKKKRVFFSHTFALQKRSATLFRLLVFLSFVSLWYLHSCL